MIQTERTQGDTYKSGKMKKGHRAIKITLLVLVGIILAALIGGWIMFGTQFKAAMSIQKLEDGLYALKYEGDYGFDTFLAQGGADTDGKMGDYIASFFTHGFWKPDISAVDEMNFGCSTISIKDRDGRMFFGRNYDWDNCDAMIVHTKPDDGYESISTCCLNFLGFGEGWKPEGMMNQFMALATIYVPLDGMNETGLCIADLMAGDDVETHQNTNKPDLTVTAAIRLLLDHATTVNEAIDLLNQYDMNSSIGSAHHLAISDATGKSVVVEYIDGKMYVTETPIVTNHYLTDGKKFGIGSKQSHKRFNTLSTLLQDANNIMTSEEVRNCLQSVAQSNYSDSPYETQWSIVFNLDALTAEFYWQEQYNHAYSLVLKDKKSWLYDSNTQ